MSTDLRRDEHGFTLIEVLVAMVILAIGLLGLEALGIGAARSIALAERQSQYATIASDSLESAIHQLRDADPALPVEFCQDDLPHGDRLSSAITLPGGPPGPGDQSVATITIRVIPNPESINSPADEFMLSSTVYVPNGPFGEAPGSPCS